MFLAELLRACIALQIGVIGSPALQIGVIGSPALYLQQDFGSNSKEVERTNDESDSLFHIENLIRQAAHQSLKGDDLLKDKSYDYISQINVTQEDSSAQDIYRKFTQKTQHIDYNRQTANLSDISSKEVKLKLMPNSAVPPEKLEIPFQEENNSGLNETTQRLPQAIIIGVKKGGTRALLEFLRVHPNIRATGPEIHFFDRFYDKGIEWYRNQMPRTKANHITIEKTPSYWITKKAPQRIADMATDTRLIVVVRDPVTRALSDYSQSKTKRPEIGTFEELAFKDNETNLVDTSWGAIRIGLYAKHLANWLKVFPLSSLHFVHGEKLITDPAGELAGVEDFLGLDRFITDKHFYYNSTKGFPCVRKHASSSSHHCLGKSKGRPHPQVSRKVLDKLRSFFRPYNIQFYEMTGINFGWS